MRVFLAWHNTTHNLPRMLAAISGITLAILLVFMQLGSLETLKRAGVLVYDAVEFDLILVSNEYQYMTRSGNLPAVHLSQANVVDGVARVTPLNLGEVWWEDPDTRVHSSVMLLGVDPDSIDVRDPRIREGLPGIRLFSSVLVDELSHPAFGDLSTGRTVRMAERSVTIAGRFHLGMGLFAQGTAIVNNATYLALTRSRTDQITFGLVELEDGADPVEVKSNLRKTLPPSVVIFDRSELNEFEQHYYVSVMPLGIMARIGVFIALLVGAVILYQVLSTDINQRLHQYATLKATGFTNAYIFETGLHQASLYAVLSFVPSALLAVAVFRITQLVTRLPFLLTIDLVVRVFVVTWIMCLAAGMSALLRVRKADPAGLFR